jgi:excisionase family DNA binding protein
VNINVLNNTVGNIASDSEINVQEIYRAVFREYPDVLDVKQVSEVLSVSAKTVYRLLRDDHISSLKVGREFRIPKVNVMKYIKVFGATKCEQPTA